jgi:AAHS family 3-hydroxyphenylpropionic acid transporter
MLVAVAMVFYLPHVPVQAKKAVESATWKDILGPNKLAITLSLWLATFLTLAVMYLLVMWLPSLMAAKGLSRPDAAIVQMLFNLGSTVAAFATGFALDKKYIYSVPAVGYIVLAVVLAYLGMMPIELLMGMVLGFLLGIGVTTGQTLLYAYAPLCYPAGIRNTGTGYAIAAGRVGTIAGPFAAGMLLAAGLSADQVLTVVAPIAIVTMLVVFLVAWLLQGATATPVSREGMAT